MRRPSAFILLLLALAVTFAWRVPSASAQYGGGRPTADDQQRQEEAARRKRDQEFGTNQPSLPQMKNAGPCPYVKSLYDAARYVEFKDNQEASATVAYTGEIEDIGAACAYKGGEPIRERLQLLFEFGRGPQATSNRKTYVYWVAVTDRNRAVLAKERFELPVDFPAGRDRVTITENLGDITIPRANSGVSGANFEILVGFEVTPEMADFNRQGKRFRLTAGASQTAAAAP